MSQSTSTKTTRSPQLQRLQQVATKLNHNFHEQHSKASAWLKHKAVDIHGFREKSQQVLAAASLAGSIAMHQPSVDAQVQHKLLALAEETKQEGLLTVTQEEYDTVVTKLKAAVQMPVGQLQQEEELYLEQQLSDLLGFEVTAELEDHRLNHTVGIMGGEQHLRRFPTDSLDQHDSYLEAGIAPNRGAFGWFTEGVELSEAAIQREKYYFAVQTLYLPDWNQNHAQLKPWYKFRKMIAINPAEELAVVGVVGDAGPANWVKKQFGGSPEVIREGRIWSPISKGRVILLFVDDPDDVVPLGPVDLRTLSPQAQQQLAAADKVNKQ